jgi:hypothetical protein
MIGVEKRVGGGGREKEKTKGVWDPVIQTGGACVQSHRKKKKREGRKKSQLKDR